MSMRCKQLFIEIEKCRHNTVFFFHLLSYKLLLTPVMSLGKFRYCNLVHNIDVHCTVYIQSRKILCAEFRAQKLCVRLSMKWANSSPSTIIGKTKLFNNSKDFFLFISLRPSKCECQLGNLIDTTSYKYYDILTAFSRTIIMFILHCVIK